MEKKYIRFYLFILLFFLLFIKIDFVISQTWQDFNFGLEGGNVQHIIENPMNTHEIYLATKGGGVYRIFDLDQPKAERISSGLPMDWVVNFLLIKGTKLFAATDQGIFVLNSLNTGETWKRYNAALKNYRILKMRDCNTGNGFYAIGGCTIDSQKLLMVSDSSNYTIAEPKDHFNLVYDLIPFRDIAEPDKDTFGNFYIGTDKGVLCYSDGLYINGNPKLDNKIIKCLAERYIQQSQTKNNFLIYAGGIDSLYHSYTSDKKWWGRIPDFNHSIVQLTPWMRPNLNEIKTFILTNDSKIYQTTDYFYKTDNLDTVTQIHISDNFKNDSIQVILPLESNPNPLLFIGSKSNIYIQSTSDCKTFGFYANNVHDIFFDRSSDSSRIWATTDGNLFVNNMERTELCWHKVVQFADNTVVTRYPGNNYIYWGTQNRGLWQLDILNQTIKSFSSILEKKTITCLKYDQTGAIMYIGTNKGIYQYSDGKVDPIVYDLNGKSISAIENGTEVKTIFIATDTILYKIFDKNIISANRINGIDSINCLAYNHQQKCLYLGTKNGIWLINENQSIPVWEKYSELDMIGQNVQKLEIVPTHSRFCGRLYALISNHNNNKSQIFRKIINQSEIEPENTGEQPEDYQSFQTFCVNQDKPDEVIAGTRGTGVTRYSFKNAQKPNLSTNVVDNILNFGDVLKGTTKTETIRIDNNNNEFHPLIITISFSQTNEYTAVDIPIDTLILYPKKVITFPIKFIPSEYNSFETNLKIEWQDNFKKPVLKGSINILVKGKGVGGDLLLNGNGNNRQIFEVKRHIEAIDTIYHIPWSKVGTFSLKNFHVSVTKNCNWFKVDTTEWKDALNSNAISGQLDYHFHPNAMAKDFIELKISFNRGGNDIDTNEIKIKGIGQDAILEIENIPPDDTLDYGSVPYADKSRIKSILLKNVGNIPLNVTNRMLLNEEDLSFRIIPKKDLPYPILPSNSIIYDSDLEFSAQNIEKIHYNDFKIIYYDSSRIDNSENKIIHSKAKSIKNILNWIPPEALDFDSIHVNNLPDYRPLIIQNESDIYNVWIDSLTCMNGNVFFPPEINEPIILPISSTPYSAKIEFNTSKFRYYEDKLTIHYRWGQGLVSTDTSEKKIKLSGTALSSKLESNISDWLFQACTDTYDFKIFEIQNNGNIALHYKFSILPPINDHFLFDKVNGNEYSIIGTSKIDELSIKYNPQKKLDFSEQKINFEFWDIDENKKEQNDTTLTYKFSGNGFDCTPPEITLSKYITDSEIEFKIADDYSPVNRDGLELYIRRGGASNFNTPEDSVTIINIDTFVLKIPTDYITPRGYDFYIKASDSSPLKNTTTYPSETTYLSPSLSFVTNGITKQEDYTLNDVVEYFSGGSTRGYYQFISVPLQPEKSKSTWDILQESFGLNDFHKFRWQAVDLHFNEDTQELAQIYMSSYEKNPGFSCFLPGKSFLVLLNYEYPKRKLINQTGKTIPNNSVFSIPLHKDWNFIANPFNFPIPIGNVQLKSGNKFSLYTYDGHWKPIEAVDSSNLSHNYILPWEGNAIQVNEADDLLIFPNLNPMFSPYPKTEATKKIIPDWFIKIVAECDEVIDGHNIAGIIKMETDDSTTYNLTEPLEIGQYISLSFSNQLNMPNLKKYTVKMQSESKNGNYWDFSVSTNIPHKDVKLTFTNIESVPLNSEITLICKSLAHHQNLRENNELKYLPINENAEHSFRLIVGSKNFIQNNNLGIDALPKNYLLSPNYPNPFTCSTTLKYAIPKQDVVSIKIINILGQIVRTIEEKTIKEPGYFIINWNGENNQGQTVSNGVYFFQFSTRNFSKTIKMILIR